MPDSRACRRSRAVCEDESLLGVPFYVMTYLDGLVPTDDAPPGLETEAARRALGFDLVDSLVEIHAADLETPTLAAFARPGSYSERQVRRFAQLWEINKTREIVRVEEVGATLAEQRARSAPGDRRARRLRLGNTMVARDDPTRILAVLDWEMGAIGDPRADVGYLLATYSEPGGVPNPLGTSPITALAGFPSRAELVERYVAQTGRNVEQLRVVRGAGAVEGRGVLRGDLRALRARRARCGGRARGAFRGRSALPRGSRRVCHLATMIR